MVERIRNLDPNLKLKIISVILALVIWYMINAFSDPAIRMTVNNVSVVILSERRRDRKTRRCLHSAGQHGCHPGCHDSGQEIRH